ncbi:MAG: VanW family protein [Clostridia bacterium]
MKKINGEKIYVILISLLVIIAVIVLGIYLFSSYKGLSNNKPDEKGKVEQKNHTKDSVLSEEEKKAMNVDKSKSEQTKEVEIANFSSSIYDKDENRIFNIGLAISKLNDVIIKKGENFSFNHTIGPMGQKQGYKEATGFDTNGNKIKVFGGGMCQISSTLYNSALIANLEIIERHPHSKRVYYVPKNKDATIYYDSLDLKFKNNTNNDIKIVASNDNVTVIIKLIKIEKTISTI